ncbi:metallophosphoesterase family protein [Sorangium sp. So ce861]|uniref:metallophosphoesterase family protein n=1 Tax=Sorangium sp. So ce861 TaxID=3133323 RepID=UPI003F5DE23E
MTTIAHLTDFHLLEADHDRRRGAERWRLRYLSFGRPIDAAQRRRRALAALVEAWRSGADHLVLTGDLTEDGTPAQFDVLAAVLAESGWDPARVTLVPGNHDAYGGGDAWERALEGCLRPFAATSGRGAVVSLPGAFVTAVSTAMMQPVTRSAGSIADRELARVAALAAGTRRSGDALVLAQHHPPLPHPIGAMQWLDGLINSSALMALLHEHDHLHVIHGHTHREHDAPVRSGAPPRIFCAQALVDGPSPLRFYRVRYGRLLSERTRVRSGASTFALA